MHASGFLSQAPAVSLPGGLPWQLEQGQPGSMEQLTALEQPLTSRIVLYCCQEVLSGIELPFPKAITCSFAHPQMILFPFMIIPSTPPVFLWVTSQIN